MKVCSGCSGEIGCSNTTMQFWLQWRKRLHQRTSATVMVVEHVQLGGQGLFVNVEVVGILLPVVQYRQAAMVSEAAVVMVFALEAEGASAILDF